MTLPGSGQGRQLEELGPSFRECDPQGSVGGRAGRIDQLCQHFFLGTHYPRPHVQSGGLQRGDVRPLGNDVAGLDQDLSDPAGYR